MSKKNLSVLHVHDVAYVASTLVSGLCDIDVDALLYELSNSKKTYRSKVLQKIITFILRFLEIFRLGEFLRKENKFDIIHVHYGSFAYLAFLNRVPYYLHIHGTDVRTFINQPILGNFIRYGINKAKVVFYTTPDLQPLVELHRKDAIFFPNSVNTDMFKPSNIKLASSNPKIFIITKLDRFKGTKEVLRGIELLWEQAPDVTVEMFGFGNSLSEAKGFLDKNIDNPRLHILSRVPHEKMISLINDSTLILGNMGTGILTCSELEAMACAKPVICMFKYAEMYPSYPPIFFANTAEEICAQIEYILNNPVEAQKKGEEARAWVVKHYDKRVVARKLVEIYQAHCD